MTMLNDAEHREIEQRDPHCPELALPAKQRQRLVVQIRGSIDV
jgi:hypothetical protein